MEMRPQNNAYTTSAKHPFGNKLPPNYFCHFEFDLNPRISYDIAMKKFFFSWDYQNEIIDVEVISAMEGSNSYL